MSRKNISSIQLFTFRVDWLWGQPKHGWNVWVSKRTSPWVNQVQFPETPFQSFGCGVKGPWTHAYHSLNMTAITGLVGKSTDFQTSSLLLVDSYPTITYHLCNVATPGSSWYRSSFQGRAQRVPRNGSQPPNTPPPLWVIEIRRHGDHCVCDRMAQMRLSSKVSRKGGTMEVHRR